jgi:hypothetical protein
MIPRESSARTRLAAPQAFPFPPLLLSAAPSVGTPPGRAAVKESRTGMLGVALCAEEGRVVRQRGAFPDAVLTLATHPCAELTWVHDCIAVHAAQVTGLGFRSDDPGDPLRVDSANRRHDLHRDRPGRH